MMFPWRSKAAKIAVLAVLGCASFAAQDPVISVQVNLVRVIATVKNRAGQLVGALKKDDFEIFDNGAKQEIRVFERQTEQPLSIALMIDISGSTAKDLKYETDSAARFLRALLSEGNPKDAVALYTFNDQVSLLQSYTHNVASLESRFKYIRAEGATAVFDAIYLSSEDLESREGRKVIVLITDGDDTMSVKKHTAALENAQLADAVIYPIVVIPVKNDAGRNVGGEHTLQFMAERTGGRTFLPTLGPQLDKAFTDIISELRTQYMIGFYPHDVPLTKDRYHTLVLRVKDPELQVSARNGYYGDADGTAGGKSDARIDIKPDRSPAPPDRKKKSQFQ